MKILSVLVITLLFQLPHLDRKSLVKLDLQISKPEKLRMQALAVISLLIK